MRLSLFVFLALAACATDTDSDTELGTDVDTGSDTDTDTDSTVTETFSEFRGTSPVTGSNVRVGFQVTYMILSDEDLGIGPFIGSVPVNSDGSWGVQLPDALNEEVVWDYSGGEIFDWEGEGRALSVIPVLFRDLDGDQYWSVEDEVIDARMDLWLLYVGTPPNDSWEQGWTLAEPDVQYDGGPAEQVSASTSIDFTERWVQQTLDFEVTWTGTPTQDLRVAGFFFDDLEDAIEYDSEGDLVTEPAFDVSFLGGSAEVTLDERPDRYLSGYWDEVEFGYTRILPIVYADTNRNLEIGVWENTYDEVAAATFCDGSVAAYPWYVGNPDSPQGLLVLQRWGISPGWHLNTELGNEAAYMHEAPVFSSTNAGSLTSNPETCDYFDVIP